VVPAVTFDTLGAIYRVSAGEEAFLQGCDLGASVRMICTWAYSS
jgi:hypothetical protein